MNKWFSARRLLGLAVVGGALLLGKNPALRDKAVQLLPAPLRPQVEALVERAPGALGVNEARQDATAAPASDEQRSAAAPEFPLVARRKGLKTGILGTRDESAIEEPPEGVLETVHYPAQLGSNVAYITPVKPGPRRPAILWIAGGFVFGVSSTAWAEAGREDDQSARQFREAGIVTMYPGLRGASQNPGQPECFLGEVDDVLRAADFLAQRPDVDPKRIYLGGHSTGGTMALLAAASSDRFRAVFSLGPVADVRQYGRSGCLTATVSDAEALVRAPTDSLYSIVSPTYVIEGAKGNVMAFPMLKRRMGKAPITFVEVPGATHFTNIAPACETIAQAILKDTTEPPALAIRADAIAQRLTL